LVASLSLSGCGNDSSAAGPGPDTLIGSAAPRLRGPDLVGGGRIDVASLPDRPTVVAFWLYACPHCKEFVPALQQAWDEAQPDANIVTVALQYDHPDQVDTSGGFASSAEFVAATGLRLPTVTGGFGDAASRWRLHGVPTVFVLAPDRTIRAVFAGEPAVADVLAAVAAASASPSASPSA
jgi:protein-disulfide isomerase